MRWILIFASVASLTACAITQKVEPSRVTAKEICIIEAPGVKAEFRDAIAANVTRKGYAVRKVEATTAAGCPATLTYTAHWNWDLALYLTRAEINLFEGGIPAGRASYDSTMGGANMAKFISAEDKVAELVQELFPAGPIVWTAPVSAPDKTRPGRL